MSSTRHADNSKPIRQERYASAPAFNDSLKASAVARKCRLLSNPAHREVCLFLQYSSMQPGGLAALATDFLNRYGNRIGSPAMRKHATRKTFNAAVVRAVRDELNSEDFPIKGETDAIDLFGRRVEAVRRQAREDSYDSEYVAEYVAECVAAETARQEKEAARFPNSYPAQAFIDYCMDSAEERIEGWLTDFCLNPETRLTNPPHWFHELEQSLCSYMNDCRANVLAGKVVTSIGEQINDALEYAWSEKCMVHISGIARMGKTFQVREWCAAHPGRVRYVQVPSGNDDISFLRAIARALGTAAGSAMKTTQIKRQIEDTIQDAGIMLVFDEGHYLFPQYKDVRSSPRRISWLLTEVVNKGIPVALVTTPQFDTSQKAIVNGSGWASEQLDGRIAFRLNLPTTLPDGDLAAIARSYLPEAEKKVVDGLCIYAKASGKYLFGVESVAKRSRFLAKKAGRSTPGTAELKAAMMEVDPTIAKIKPKKEREEVVRKPPAKAKKRVCRPAAQVVHSSGKQLVAAQ